MNVQSIPAWHSFTEVLAYTLLQDPEVMGQSIILLPNRRACRVLRESLVRQNQGNSLILPRMMPFADLDPEDIAVSVQWIDRDILPPIQNQSRLGILMQLIIKYGQSIGESGYGQARHAIQLAGELARLIDQIHWEGLSFDQLIELVPDDYARHWQITLDFLKIITEHWPAIMKAKGVSDPAAWRRDLILGYANKWEQEKPEIPIIAAGSTGSIPCTAHLLRIVAGLPQGRVILPGLDHGMPDEEWQQLEITHPQYGMAKLLQGFEIDRTDISQLHAGAVFSSSATARFHVLSRAMQPSVGRSWQVCNDLANTAMQDLQLIECKNTSQEAGIIALIMRQALEVPEKTVALVTPDRGLVARVHKELERWDLRADDTGGSSLLELPESAFMLLLVESLLNPSSILSLLKVLHHPLLTKSEHAELFLFLDLEEFRLYRTVDQVYQNSARFKIFYDRFLPLQKQFSEFIQQPLIDLKAIIGCHLQVAEFLVGSELMNDEGFIEFWSGLLQSVEDFPKISASDYPDLIQHMMSKITLRDPEGYHPRLFILGPLEARTLKTDVMILSSLNEGVWPSLTETDPWLNRPMRSDFGLPLPERRIGLSAHDFAQAFCAPQVYCTRALRVNGAPSVASRWLLRLETVLKASSVKINTTPQPWLGWYESLDKPEFIKPCSRPTPCPPVYARPKQFSVTQVETWMRDPYVLYARQILRLKELKEIENPLQVSEKGTLIHSILEQFIQSEKRDLVSLLSMGASAFSQFDQQPEVVNFWWPRFERIAKWFVENERARSQEIIKSYTEISGKLAIVTKAGSFTITAKADRIDVRREGGADIIDYKTGSLPSKQEVEFGLAPQLSLEAAILKGGGFSDLGSKLVHSTQYWRLRGNDPAGEIRVMGLEDSHLQQDAFAGLIDLVETYACQTVPYLAQPRPKHVLKYNAYAHLTRTQEWIRENESI